MATEVQMHVVVCVPLTIDDDTKEVTEIGQPYTCDENPFVCFDGETFVVDSEIEGDIYEWRKSTDAEITAAYDCVSALLFKREAHT